MFIFLFHAGLCVGFFVEQDGSDQYFPATVHFPLSSTIDSSQKQHVLFPLKITGLLGIEPRAAGFKRKYADLCAIMLPQKVSLIQTKWFKEKVAVIGAILNN